MDSIVDLAPAGASDENGEFMQIDLPASESQAVIMITEAYLSQIDPDEPPEPEQIENDILRLIKNAFLLHNKSEESGTKWRIPRGLPWYVIPYIMLHMHEIRNISCAGANFERDYDILGIYQECGKDEGTYAYQEWMVENLIARYNMALSEMEVKQVKLRLKNRAKRVERCSDPDLVAVNNGIFNYKTKTLMPFHPDIVFTAKSHVDYNPAAVNVIIHNDDDGTDWDLETWIRELSDDAGVPELLWQVIGAVIRPNVRWNRSAWFVSEQGNNGKGTLCHLMRNITGPGTYAAIQLSDFGKEFMLEPLIGATSIITDENDVGNYIEKAANLKAVITNDVIQINRKFKTPIAYRFKGFMVQCVNEMPRVKDKSESFYRRLLIIPFKKCYTGRERKYIKEDYLNRKEVLEYALYKILNMSNYILDEPAACVEALGQYKAFNDPIRDFLREALQKASWDCIPQNILYEMYKGWSRINNPNGMVPGSGTFYAGVRNIIGAGLYGWEAKKHTRISGRMDGEEYLLEEYGCRSSMRNPDSNDPIDHVTAKHIPESTDGLFRASPSVAQTAGSTAEEE